MTQKFRLIVIGNSSNRTSVFNLSIINVLRYTPAVEASQPNDVPTPQNGNLSHNIIRVGGSTTLTASGFKPGENLKGWITTPFNRVVSYSDLAASDRAGGDYPYTLNADEDGNFSGDFAAPGSAEPGIYAFTLQGTESGTQSIVYFRVRSGPIQYYNPTWALYSGLAGFKNPNIDFSDAWFQLANLNLSQPFYKLEPDN
jgi:hypothetical protein